MESKQKNSLKKIYFWWGSQQIFVLEQQFSVANFFIWLKILYLSPYHRKKKKEVFSWHSEAVKKNALTEIKNIFYFHFLTFFSFLLFIIYLFTHFCLLSVFCLGLIVFLVIIFHSCFFWKVFETKIHWRQLSLCRALNWSLSVCYRVRNQ